MQPINTSRQDLDRKILTWYQSLLDMDERVEDAGLSDDDADSATFHHYWDTQLALIKAIGQLVVAEEDKQFVENSIDWIREVGDIKGFYRLSSESPPRYEGAFATVTKQ